MIILKNKKVYFALVFIFSIALLIRVLNLQSSDFITQHISNFAITGGIFLLAFYKDLLKKGFTKNRLLFELSSLALINIVFELFVNIGDLSTGAMNFVDFNTPDPIDMIFGFAAIALLYFVITKNSVKKRK